MKNVHILPTDKPSRVFNTNKGEYYFREHYVPDTIQTCKNYNIYITSDEEIKEDDYYLSWENYYNPPKYVIYVKSSGVNGDGKKITLTTDQDLIKDGVQAIDDEFLEWFVKNPSCEWVEVELFPKFSNNLYGIIIPQGEPKQETLEEAAGNYASKKLQRPITIYNPLESNVAEYVGFIEGAKWQQERMYSEEELEVAFFEGRENTLSFNEWFEQFKKK
jgi:hypothetical protein